MKRTYTYLIILLFTLPLISLANSPEEIEPFSTPSKVSDSVLFKRSERALPEDLSGVRRAIDTIDTDEKFSKIVLFDDHTWQLVDIGRPIINEEIIYDDFDTLSIHSYKDLTLNDLPDEVHICLYDSLHPAYVPITGKINSKYRYRRTREHKGTDIDLERGDPIKAPFDGVVRVSESSRHTGGYGHLIVLRHNNGLETYYGHLSQRNVKPGDIVKAGEIIGLGGNSGRSTGPHLHLEVRYMGKPFDPERIFDFNNGVVRDSIITIKKHYFSIYSHYGQTDEESKAASGRLYHKIRSGDTLGAIAIKYGTTVTKICQMNSISRNTTLRIGRQLRVR